MGRVRWLHIGSTEKWGNKSTASILKVAKEKLRDHMMDAEINRMGPSE